MATLVNEADWKDYIIGLLRGCMDSLPENEAEETKQAFEDIRGWVHSASMSIGNIAIELVRIAKTPQDRARIDSLLAARALLDTAEEHLSAVASGGEHQVQKIEARQGVMIERNGQ